MKIILLTSEPCNCIAIEKELQALGFAYERHYVEDEPEIAERFHIRHCPTLIIDEKRVIAIDEVNASQLKQLLMVTDSTCIENP